MAITASQLRQNIYRLLDGVLEHGVPLEIERRGRRLRIVPVGQPPRLERLPLRPETVVGDPADLVELGWAHEWRPM